MRGLLVSCGRRPLSPRIWRGWRGAWLVGLRLALLGAVHGDDCVIWVRFEDEVGGETYDDV